MKLIEQDTKLIEQDTKLIEQDTKKIRVDSNELWVLRLVRLGVKLGTTVKKRRHGEPEKNGEKWGLVCTPFARMWAWKYPCGRNYELKTHLGFYTHTKKILHKMI